MSSVLSVAWKQEPLSPSSNEDVTWFSEDTLYCTTLKQDDLESEDPLYSGCNTKAAAASQLLEDLENLVDLDELIKEEPFYIDVKMLPILEVETTNQSIKFESYKPSDTQSLLNEFQSVCNVFDYTHNTLTPPQSPPSESPRLTTLQPVVTQDVYPVFPEKQQHPPSYIVPEKQLLDNVLVYRPVESPSTPQPDIAHELAVVDELVRSRVENMQWSGSSGPSSPCSNSSISSNSSNCGDYSSDDPEWMPEAVEGFATEDVATAKPARKRTKPYSRNPDDKKSRKKEQNKNAATRYRMKKKAEVEEILTEEKQLANESDKFSAKITDLEREIKYLKGLMRDLFKAKGLIK